MYTFKTIAGPGHQDPSHVHPSPGIGTAQPHQSPDRDPRGGHTQDDQAAACHGGDIQQVCGLGTESGN